MKSIHTTSWYFPDTSGGVEVYMDALTQGLQAQGIDSVVAASRWGTEEDTYQYNSVPVYRYPVYPNPDKALVHQHVPHGGFQGFADWLKAQQADVYHQHSWRYDCGLAHLNLARQLGLATVITLHMPEPFCLRGTMMLQGEVPCDGRIDPVRCSYCLGVPDRVPSAAVQLLSQVPLSISTKVEARLMAGGVRSRQLGRMFGIPPLVPYHRYKLQQMAALADRIVVVSQWQYEACVLNNVPTSKLMLCRLGCANAFTEQVNTKHQPGSPLRIGYLGRWQATKGVQVVAEAITRLPKELPVELVIHGMLGNYGQENRDRVLAMAALDHRIKVAEPVSREAAPAVMASFDMLAVPSQWLETGPLVVLEAHAVGSPVIGSDRGGIPELVQHGVNGWIVPASDIDAWSQAIAHLVQNPMLVSQLRQGVHPPRTMDQVVSDMALLYRQLRSPHQSTLAL